MERWADIPGYEGRYQVSDLGRVKSIPRKWRRKEKILRGAPDKLGYLHVHLSKDAIAKTFQVHRLVLLAFVGPCPGGMEACHFPDRFPQNNKLSNLRWDTKKANSDDSRKHGTRCGGRGPQKLTAEQVQQIRQMSGSLRQVAAMFGVSRITIHKIRAGKIWRECVA